jgi:uncharacterized protein (DUF58 family)
MKLTTLTVSTAFILIVATLLNIDQLYAMAGMLAALPLVCYFVGRRQNGGVSAKRRLDAVGVPGRPLPVTLELKNGDPWPKRHLLVQDRLPLGLERDGDARPILTPLAAGGTETVSYSLRPEKRGCFQVGPLEVMATDPLGIFQFHHELPETAELLVYPRTVALPWVFPPGGSPYGASSLHTAEMRGEGSEFYGIREYQPGDPLRRVHWRSSARMGRLAVVEYEHDVSVDLTLVLDARRGSDLGAGVDTTLETAVTIAASLARMVLERGNRCRLVIPGVAGSAAAAGARGSAAHGAEALHTLLEALARVTADQVETAVEGVASILPELERDSTVALITSVWDEPARQAVAAVVNAGLAALVIYVDPESFRRSGDQAVSGVQASGRSGVPDRHDEPAFDGIGPERLTSERLTPDAGEAIRAQILALRAQPVIIRHGLDLTTQFALAATSRA